MNKFTPKMLLFAVVVVLAVAIVLELVSHFESRISCRDIAAEVYYKAAIDTHAKLYRVLAEHAPEQVVSKFNALPTAPSTNICKTPGQKRRCADSIARGANKIGNVIRFGVLEPQGQEVKPSTASKTLKAWTFKILDRLMALNITEEQRDACTTTLNLAYIAWISACDDPVAAQY